MTLKQLTEMIRDSLFHIAQNPQEPVDQEKGLQIWGVPADDEMREVLTAFGGTLRISVMELPQQMVSTEPVAGNLWHPDGA